jgi:hypothetical protein
MTIDLVMSSSAVTSNSRANMASFAAGNASSASSGGNKCGKSIIAYVRMKMRAVLKSKPPRDGTRIGSRAEKGGSFFSSPPSSNVSCRKGQSSGRKQA